MSNHRDHNGGVRNGKAKQGHGSGQAAEAEPRKEEAPLSLGFRLAVSKEAEEIILRESLLPLWNPDFEVCGLVLDDWTFYAIRNVHPRPERNFQFCIADLDTFIKVSHIDRVIGIYHSHPSNDPNPSADDMAGKPDMEGLRYWIVTQNQVVEWSLCDSAPVRISAE